MLMSVTNLPLIVKQRDRFRLRKESILWQLKPSTHRKAPLTGADTLTHLKTYRPCKPRDGGSQRD